MADQSKTDAKSFAEYIDDVNPEEQQTDLSGEKNMDSFAVIEDSQPVNTISAFSSMSSSVELPAKDMVTDTVTQDKDIRETPDDVGIQEDYKEEEEKDEEEEEKDEEEEENKDQNDSNYAEERDVREEEGGTNEEEQPDEGTVQDSEEAVDGQLVEDIGSAALNEEEGKLNDDDDEAEDTDKENKSKKERSYKLYVAIAVILLGVVLASIPVVFKDNQLLRQTSSLDNNGQNIIHKDDLKKGNQEDAAAAAAAAKRQAEQEELRRQEQERLDTEKKAETRWFIFKVSGGIVVLVMMSGGICFGIASNKNSSPQSKQKITRDQVAKKPILKRKQQQ